MATAAPTQNIGHVVQVIGPVLDVEFDAERLPELYNALELTVRDEEGEHKVVAEVQQHIGRNQARAVAMSTTDSVTRGMEVVDTGAPISVPVGAPALGRILNVLGEPVDNGPPIPPNAERWPIHRKRPDFVELEPKTEVFETGIKVIDLIAPFVKGARSVCSAVPASARPSSFRSSSTTSPRATVAVRCSAVWASGRAKATTCTSSSRKRAFSIRSR